MVKQGRFVRHVLKRNEYLSFIALPKEENLYFHGVIKVRVLFGQLSCFGCQFDSSSGWLDLCSAEYDPYLYLHCLNIASNNSIDINELDEDVLNHFKTYMGSHCCFLIEDLYPSKPLDIPIGEINDPLRLPESYGNIVNDISLVQNGQQSNNAIVCLGSRNSGKSTFLRFLTNILLQTNEYVYYIDTDPGQTEFSASGFLSLTRIETPILSPPAYHFQKPDVQIYYGDTTAQTNPRAYLQAFCKLKAILDVIFEEDDVPILINTHGWISSLGADLLKNILEVFDCNTGIIMYDVSLENGDETNAENFKNISNLLENVFVCESVVNFSKNPNNTPAFDRRLRKLTSFFIDNKIATCASIRAISNELLKQQIHGIGVNNISIMCSNDDITNLTIGMILPLAIVGLCHIEQDIQDREAETEGIKIVSHNNSQICDGIGIVRAVTLDESRVFLLTSLNQQELIEKRINCLVFSSQYLPSQLISFPNSVGYRPYVSYESKGLGSSSVSQRLSRA
eukprot:TRINITY_DN2870_c0_g1_i1.p1 TRINITY_DN2870_c0_g1~~TRINITY_DN2870_c0_g1_i1.p1  ORF type:complete len:519 (+),score=120.02 TRINITY_DN2870_c0_g1_i1:33-1559(+)